jgi:hypothetical protein
MDGYDILRRIGVSNLDELRELVVGEPFAGRIKFPNGSLEPSLIIKPEMQRGDNYLFLTLPSDEGIHQIEVAGRDVLFFSAVNTGRPQPLFDHQRARINTYSPTDNWFRFYQNLVETSLKRYEAALSQLRTGQLAGKV